MKKFVSLVCALFGLICSAQISHADSVAQPVLISFAMSPYTIDLATSSTTVSFDLVVSNPTGIASTQTRVSLTNGSGNTLVGFLVRTDVPVNPALSTVNFRGSISIPSSISPGVYTATASPVTALNPDGTNGYSTNTLSATSASTLAGAPNAILIRSNGILNFAYPTFAGPTFNNILGNSFRDPSFLSAPTPIWKVGETFDPAKYYELKNPALSLKIKSNTNAICTSDGKLLSLISVGACSFTVYTDKTNDYQLYQDNQIVNVTGGRTKPTYAIGTIATQSSSTLPLTIPGPIVYSPFGNVIPITATPTVCFPVGSFITIVSGGTCTLNYSTPASGAFIASDVYPLTFEITRSSQTISFITPTSAIAGSKSFELNATSSIGAPVTYRSQTSAICSVTGNVLNFLSPGNCQIEAIQIGTSTVAPASAIQTIKVSANLGESKKKYPSTKVQCQKNGIVKTFPGAKCPTGFRIKK